MNIDNNKLEALHQYLVKGGSAEQEDVAKQLGVDADDGDAVDAYVEALKAKWPDTYGEPVAPAPAAKKAAKKVAKTAEPAPATYRLRKPDGTVAALEVVASKNGTVFLQEPRPTEPVEILLRGQRMTVDLIELRSKPEGSMFHDLLVSKVIEIAELAKA